MLQHLIITCFLLPLASIGAPHSSMTIGAHLDFNELMSQSDLVVLAEAVTTESVQHGNILAQVQYFEIKETIKGVSPQVISLQTHALYQGDVVQEMIKPTLFKQNGSYLLFLPNASGTYDLDQITVLEEIDHQGDNYFTMISSEGEAQETTADFARFDKESLLNAIGSFLYHEVAILPSEIMAEAE